MDGPVEGFAVPVHRALIEPILLGGAPRAIAILNGTVAAALGLGLRLWIAGLLLGRLAMPPPSGQQGAIRCLSKLQGGICVSPPI
jgi:type IV secretory pathway TrbD component